MNTIIHPRVSQHFYRWIKKQQAVYCIKETAILFESGGHEKCDVTILVTAPREIRINRIMVRDGLSREAIESRMNNQWSDERKRELADYVIENIAINSTREQVRKIHEKLNKIRY